MDLLRDRWPCAVAGAALAVYLLLALCSYPALDDWIFAQRGRDLGVFTATGIYLQEWGGRWASAILLYGLGLLPDLALGYPLVVLAGFALAAWALRRGSAWPATLIAGVPLLAWLPAPAEGPYWLSGGITYLLPLILLVVAGTLPSARWSSAVRVALGAGAAGCSETAMLLGAAGTAVACLLHDRRHAWTLAGIVLGGAAAVLAPGNAARLAVVADGQRVDLLSAALAALPRTGRELLGLLPSSWLSPVAPALTALVLASAPSSQRHGAWIVAAVIAATLGGALAALLASNAAIGFIEGRQANAIWLHLILGAVAAAWVGLTPCDARMRVRVLLAWWALCWLQVAWRASGDLAALLVATLAVMAAAWIAWRTWRTRTIAAPAWLALGLLAAPGLCAAVGDLWRAPQRRAEQWQRDAVVRTMREQGARAVRIPLLNPELFPVTLSIGDLQSGHWATAGYASWQRLDSVLVDPRLRTPQAR